MAHCDQHHKPTRVARSSVAAVDACSCGTVHLHIGAATLHLTSDALRTLSRTLIEATVAIERDKAPRPWVVNTHSSGTA